MFVELIRPLADHKPGDLIEVDPAAADTLSRRGYTRQPDDGKSLADFLVCLQTKNRTRLANVYRAVEQKAALGEDTGAAGGFLIPDELLAEILLPIQSSIVRSRALVAPMKSSTLDIPLLAPRTSEAGQSPFFGTALARWTEDGIALSQLAPQLQNLKLKAHLLAAYVVLTNTLLADSPKHLADRLRLALAAAWSWHEERAFLLGTGVGQPMGVAVSPAALSVTRTNANDFTLVDAAKMVAKLIPGWSPATTCWIVHPTVHAKLFALAANAGPAVTLTLFGKTPKLVLLGIPVETTDVLPALGTARDVVLADLSYYTIGSREDFALAYSGEPFFTSNQGLWRLTSRVDGAPFVSGPITLAEGSQVGPFAYLA